MSSQTEQDYPADEAQRRFEQALKAAVTTPPVPMKDRPTAASVAAKRKKSGLGGGT